MLRGRALAVLASFAVAASCGVAGGRVEEFSADQVTVMKGGGESVSRLFFTPEKVRIEVALPQGEMVTIVRRDRKVIWSLLPDRRAYHESTLDEREMEKALAAVPKESISDELGAAELAGFRCRKVRTHSTIEMMGQSIESTSVAWITDSLPVPLRVEHSGGTVTELRNITPGRQPAELFEIPAGFTATKGILMPGAGRDLRERSRGR